MSDQPQSQPNVTILPPEQPPSRSAQIAQIVSSVGVIITGAVALLFILGILGLFLYALFAA